MLTPEELFAAADRARSIPTARIHPQSWGYDPLDENPNRILTRQEALNPANVGEPSLAVASYRQDLSSEGIMRAYNDLVEISGNTTRYRKLLYYHPVLLAELLLRRISEEPDAEMSFQVEYALAEIDLQLGLRRPRRGNGFFGRLKDLKGSVPRPISLG
jgi:hypothetical protein